MFQLGYQLRYVSHIVTLYPITKILGAPTAAKPMQGYSESSLLAVNNKLSFLIAYSHKLPNLYDNVCAYTKLFQLFSAQLSRNRSDHLVQSSSVLISLYVNVNRSRGACSKNNQSASAPRFSLISKRTHFKLNTVNQSFAF